MTRIRSRGVSAIVPAFNEEKTIDAVLSVLVRSHDIDEVIVVDDGSTDRTAERARAAGARVLRQDNQGKSAAMRAGSRAALSPTILFVDADLTGLNEQHVSRLIEPVLRGSARMAIGLRDRGPFWNWCMATILPKIGGERAVSRRDFFEMARDAEGFGIESAMNAYCRKRRLSVSLVPLSGVMHTLKEKKYGIVRGLIVRFKMIYDVIRAEAKSKISKSPSNNYPVVSSSGSVPPNFARKRR